MQQGRKKREAERTTFAAVSVCLCGVQLFRPLKKHIERTKKKVGSALTDPKLFSARTARHTAQPQTGTRTRAHNELLQLLRRAVPVPARVGHRDHDSRSRRRSKQGEKPRRQPTPTFCFLLFCFLPLEFFFASQQRERTTFSIGRTETLLLTLSWAAASLHSLRSRRSSCRRRRS